MKFDLRPRSLHRAKISALGTYVPPRLLTNADLEKMVDTNDQWIVERTGIRTRHIVDPGSRDQRFSGGSGARLPGRARH